MRVVPPEGLIYRPEFVAADEAEALGMELEALPYPEVPMPGVFAGRMVVPPFLEPLRARAAALAEVGQDDMAEVQVIQYPAGAGVAWHRDALASGAVVGVSLGAACTVRFRRHKPGGGTPRMEHYKQMVAPRSAYLLSGPARSEWQHSIPPVTALRYSITFRTVG